MQTGTVPNSVDLSRFVWARLTAPGRDIFVKHFPETDLPEDGWIRMQLQSLYNLFGPYRQLQSRPIDAFIYFERSSEVNGDYPPESESAG